jgi:murein DD-endopeptidase
MHAWIHTVVALVVGFLALLLCPLESVGQSRRPIVQSLDLAVLQPPALVAIGGVRHLVYELHITNLRTVDARLTRLEVLDAGTPASVLGKFQDAALQDSLGHVGVAEQPADMQIIGAGKRAVFYAWMPIADAVTPSALLHRIEFDVIRPAERQHVTMQSSPVNVSRDTPMILGAPLEGGAWIAVYTPSHERGHRRVIYTTDGRARIPARFAIDWMKIGPDHKFSRGGDKKISSWYGHGAKVLAVADATVADAKNDIPNEPTIAEDPPPVSLENASGNYVILDLGAGRHAIYEHLQQGSLRVKPGDRVRRGDVIAALGNTGSSSSGPHLHFHLADANATLAAEGLPYVFSQFEVLGTFDSLEEAGEGSPPRALSPGTNGVRRNEHPAAKVVVRF